jgi:endoglucanase
VQRKEAFGFMYRPDQRFGWGSNQSLIQNMIVVATAYDITGEALPAGGARKHGLYSWPQCAGDFLCDRLRHALCPAAVFQHVCRMPSIHPTPSRRREFWRADPTASLADDYAIRKRSEGCAPQACYVDDPRSFSTNEIAINWNAPLVWIASFLADAR